MVYRFTLEQETSVSLYFALRDVRSGPVVIAMSGPAGYDTAFLRLGAGAGVGRATVHPRGLQLPEGEYEVRFTFPRTPGQVAIAVKLGG